jgi:uncharacterized membrane protein
MVYPSLPETIPTHWGADGKVNGYGPRSTAFIWPALAAGMTLLMFVLPAISPKNFSMESFRHTFNYITFILVAMMGYLGFVVLYMTQNPTWAFEKPFVGGMMVFIGLLGNLMGKVQRNFFVGIRTPWTLASDKVWVATHRLGARLMTLGGLVGALLVIIGVPALYVFFAFIALILYPILYSLLLYKRLERAGSL